MDWDQGDGRLCSLICDGKTISTVQGDDYRAFQELAASLRAFESVGLIEALDIKSENHTGHRYPARAGWRIPPGVTAGQMTIAQRRWLLLRFFAAKFEQDANQLYAPTQDAFAGLAGSNARIEQAGTWLEQHGFIMWQSMLSEGGYGRILEKGHEALDHGLAMLTERQGAVMQHIDQRNQSINVGTLNAGDGDLVIGQNATINKQVLAEELGNLIRAIQQGPGDAEEKRTLISSLKGLLMHPLVVSVAGGIAGAIGG